MKIVIIGSGNVAFHLINAFLEINIPIAQVFGRNEVELQKISSKFGIPYSCNTIENADFYLIAVSDASINTVASQIPNKNALVAHTSGSISIDALENLPRKSVFYPLQTFSKEKKLDYSQIPIFIDTENENDLQLLQNLAKKISKNVSIANDFKRKHLHLTAVFACNFVNHLYARAKEIADSQNIPFDYFLPLIDETTKKIHELDPKIAQTGPAKRVDLDVLKAHEMLLIGDDKLKIYTTLNESIMKMYSSNTNNK